MGKLGEQFPIAYINAYEAQHFAAVLSPGKKELDLHQYYASLNTGYDYGAGSFLPVCLPPVYLKPSRNTCLWRILASVIIAVVALNVLSCSLYVHVTIDNTFKLPDSSLWPKFFPRSHDNTEQTPDSDVAPKLIPRIIHQTYKTQGFPERLVPLVYSWREYNDHWQTRFYDDAACIEFVRREFPQYLEAYQTLPKDVERSDFFRYMVILRQGGVYADIDVECRQPLDPIIRASDTMVVGYEAEVATDAEAFRRHFTRKRQVLQWFFAAAPGHPVLKRICDHINENALRTFSNNTNRDTLERTGPGIWTDIVLQHAMSHPSAKADDPWKVRILPRVAFGVHPAGIDNLTPDAKEIVVLHHFLGSWKVRGGWQKFSLQKLLRKVYRLLPWARRSTQEDAPEEAIKESGVPFYPVSTVFEPPFTMMVDLIGHGDKQSGRDVCATISSWGTWQAGLAPTRGPSVVNTLVNSLGRRQGKPSLLDIGAAQGFFSLAAASRGHHVISFETSERSLRPFNASIEFNGFRSLIDLRNVSLGARRETICLQRRGDSADPPDANLARGYGSPAVHAAPAEECVQSGLRVPAWEVLGNNTNIGAVRINANGWEGAIVEGLMPYLTRVHKPEVLLVELHPALMRQAGYANPTQLIESLYAIGYKDVAHAGYVCDERWYNVTRDVRAQGLYSSDAQEALKQPTWCTLKPQDFHVVEQRAHEEVPENVLFLYRFPANAAEQAAAGRRGAEQGAGGREAGMAGVAPLPQPLQQPVGADGSREAAAGSSVRMAARDSTAGLTPGAGPMRT